MKVPQLDLTTQYQSIKEEINSAIESVLESGIVINGDNVKKIENSLAAYSETKYGIGVANGSDAIFIALKALGISSEDCVISPTFTFFATAGSIVRAGATPIFVDIDSQTYNLDPIKLQGFIDTNFNFNSQINQLVDRQTGKPIKAIIPVHLYGQMYKMDEIIKDYKDSPKIQFKSSRRLCSVNRFRIQEQKIRKFWGPGYLFFLPHQKSSYLWRRGYDCNLFRRICRILQNIPFSWFKTEILS